MDLCFFSNFFGAFGLHKFYAGKIGTGIFYLLFSWTIILPFIAFIEGVTCLFKASDSDGNIVV